MKRHDQCDLEQIFDQLKKIVFFLLLLLVVVVGKMRRGEGVKAN